MNTYTNMLCVCISLSLCKLTWTCVCVTEKEVSWSSMAIFGSDPDTDRDGCFEAKMLDPLVFFLSSFTHFLSESGCFFVMIALTFCQ